MMQAQGPHLPHPVRRAIDQHDILFLEELYLHLLDFQDGTDGLSLERFCRDFIYRYPISWTHCQITLNILEPFS